MLSFADRIANAVYDKGVAVSESKPKMKSLPALEAIAKEAGGSTYRAQQFVARHMLPQLKALGTVDISALRLVSLSDRVAVRRQPQTKFLSWLESKNDSPSILDYQFRIKERDIVNNYASVFNIDAALPANQQSAYNQRYNTLTTVGDTLKVSFMLSSIAEQQADVNVLEEQIDDEIVRIRKQMNKMLLSNTEQVNEAVANTPQLGGFITRSTLNSVAAGGANLTNSTLQTALTAIINQLGEMQFMLWITQGQLAVIRDLMINRFPGENSATFYQSLDQLMADRMIKFNVTTDVAYKAYPGGIIPAIYDVDMPATTALLFAGEIPRLVRFKMDGSQGPFVLARPEPTLYDLVAVFDIFTLDDPLIVSRVQVTGLAS